MLVDPLANPLLGKAFLDSLRTEFPEEFQEKEPTLAQQLKDMDEIIYREENFLDSIDSTQEVYNEEDES